MEKIIKQLYENITFVIPSYKNIDTLKRAIDSIICQPNFCGKILISEDYSDNHEEIEKIIKQYSSYDLTYIINNPAKGMTGNWNQCIELAKTDYVVMLHDDDYLYSNYMFVLAKIFKSNLDFDIVMFDNDCISDGKAIFSENESLVRRFYNSFKSNKIKKVRPADYYFGGLQGKYVPSCGILYKRSFMINTGGYSDNDGYSVDEIFIERWSKYANIYFFNTKVAAHTYTTNTNLSSKRNVKRAFVIESYNHHMKMRYWYSIVFNNVLKRGIYFSIMYPWHEFLFPEYIVSKRANIERKIFSIICRSYIYLSSFLCYRKL